MILNNLWKSTVGFLFGWSLLAGVAACSQREIQDDDINPTPTSAVSFFVAEEEMSTITRSVLTASDIETKKTGITLAAFKDGNLYCTEHFSSNLSDISIPLEVGSYTVYALVNMGDMTASIPAKESGMAAITYQIPSYTEGDSSIAALGMPMAGSGSYTITSSTSGAQTLSVKRLLCKVEVSLNCTWPGGQLLSARVFNMNKTLTPFGENGSAAASTSDILSFQEIMDGPAGTTFSATFYVPENMQGTIQGITNSSDKRPDSGNTDISGKKDLLTYLQVEATGSTKYVGTVTYRSYLGNNATSNFDLARNTRYVWTVNYQENGLLSDNWKVDRYLIAEPEAVDLGLSVKWASFNLGALSPEDYGDYYAWGETEPKTNYVWTTYKWCEGSNNTLTKYCTTTDHGEYGYNGFVDNKTVLEYEDDAAYVALGGKWRMPTAEEWTELRDNCTWESTTLNGVKGRKVTSNKAGYTDKWIFLPATGYRGGTNFSYVGSNGFYWSSSLILNNPEYGWECLYSSSGVSLHRGSRAVGHSIRPVLEDEIVSVTYSTPSVTLSYDPVSFDADGGTAIPTVSYTQEVTTTRASGATSTEQITTGGEVTFNMEAVTGFTLDSSTGNITVAQNNTAMTRSTTVTVSVTLNGEAGTSAAVTISQSPGTPPVPEAIDLGLSVKWASFNLWASQPNEYGEYYAWGETGPKDGYNWSTYIWCKGSHTTLTKYNSNSSYGTVDNKTVLEPDDDAAHVALGGKWRMPTDEEWTALRTQCTWVWTLNYNGTGVAGMIVTATNGNSIFLPAAGERAGTVLVSVGFWGNYWSSSRNTEFPDCARDVEFDSGNVRRHFVSRFDGISVRPVLEDEIVSVTYSTPSVTLSYDPVSFDANGGTAIPTVSYSQEVTTTRASGDVTTIQVTSGGTVEFNMEAVTGFTLDSSTGNVTVAPSNTTIYRSTTVTVRVTLNGETGTSDAVKISQLPEGVVDLGLSVLWGTCNVGASNPEDYGDYFAWGETEPKTNYDWSTYKWCEGSNTTLTKYNSNSSYGTVDNKTVLEPDDDAAHVALGGKWRMPTDEEWTALRTQCTWVWTLNYNGTGVAGRIVTATNGNSIFLPAAGARNDTYLNTAGSDGHYWSSSLDADTFGPSYAWGVHFNSGNVYETLGDRRLGLSVRPVYDPAMD